MKTEAKKDIWETLGNIDARIFAWLLVICVILPMINPLGLPLRISESTRDAYDFVESLPEGSIAWFDLAMPVGSIGEHGGGAVSMFRHLRRNNIKVIVTGTGSDGDSYFVWQWMESYAPDILEGSTNGVDYVIFGPVFKAEMAVAALASDIRGKLATDYDGTPLDELPIMDNINSGADIDFVYVCTAAEHDTYYTRHWYSVFGTPIVVAMSGSDVPNSLSMWKAGFLVGVLASQRGSAEYELLMGKPGIAVRYMDSQSLGHILILVSMAIGNTYYFVGKLVKKGEK